MITFFTIPKPFEGRHREDPAERARVVDDSGPGGAGARCSATRRAPLKPRRRSTSSTSLTFPATRRHTAARRRIPDRSRAARGTSSSVRERRRPDAAVHRRRRDGRPHKGTSVPRRRGVLERAGGRRARPERDRLARDPEGARRRGADAIDYFVFSPGVFDDIPPFAVGRPVFDNWLIWKRGEKGAQSSTRAGRSRRFTRTTRMRMSAAWPREAQAGGGREPPARGRWAAPAVFAFRRDASSDVARTGAEPARIRARRRDGTQRAWAKLGYATRLPARVIRVGYIAGEPNRIERRISTGLPSIRTSTCRDLCGADRAAARVDARVCARAGRSCVARACR